MNKILLSAALAGVIAGVASTAQAAPVTMTANQEKCYGVAMKMKNDCASATGEHKCAGLATADNAKGDWKAVTKGDCGKAGGEYAKGTTTAPTKG